jgi:two-component system sensor histidine kinase DesK
VNDVWRGLGCAWRRNASVLVWTGPLLLGPVLDLHGTPGSIVFQVAMILVIGVSAITIGLTGGPPWRDPRPYVALSTLVSATFAGATMAHNYWLPTWVLLANALPCVLRGRWLVGGIAVTVGLSSWAAWAVEPHQGSRVYQEAFVVLLAALASSAFVALLDTIEELRRTRQELARVAVAEERERFSRDLHDLLGHTLSVMVVKAQAVRRLVRQDPDAAVEHAVDIEQIGRRALTDVRQAVDAMRAPNLSEELDGARRALDAAGIATSVDLSHVEPRGRADELLAWVVREGATNVLRHSGASTCRVELADRDGRIALTIADDGFGEPTTSPQRLGGLEGLRDRLAAAGGELAVDGQGEGFRLVATVPEGVPCSGCCSPRTRR